MTTLLALWGLILAQFIAPMRHPTTFHYKNHVGGEGESAFLYLQKKLIFTIFWRQLSKLTNCLKIRDAPVTRLYVLLLHYK